MLFIAAAVLLTGFQSGFPGGTASAAAGETEKKSKGAPDTAGLFYSNTICVYEETVYAIEAGNLTKKTADENDAVYTEILTDGLAGAKFLNVTEQAFYAVQGREIVRIRQSVPDAVCGIRFGK